MCGIAGCVNIGGEPFVWNRDRYFFKEMLQVQRHRGPDDQGIRGFQFEDGVNEALHFDGQYEKKLDGILGFNRLSIQDLSGNGHQPMTCRERGVILAFNGEIYNADAFRNSLREKGYQFRGHSDTEVVLSMYLEYGTDAFAELNGMFAVSVIDLKKKVVYLARDRFGIKPLYYCISGGRFYWGSEYKTFLMIPGFQAGIDPGALQEYIIFQSAPDQALLEGVHTVRPGEMISICGESILKTFFFRLDSLIREENTASLHENMEHLDELLQRTVSRQLVSDVKAGCQLSGGVDSSLVSWYASHDSANRMEDSVSVTFDDAETSEEGYIDLAAGRLGLNSHKYELGRDFLLQNLKRTVWHLEAIPTQPNAAALLMLTQKAKKHVTVLLSGEGADEVFGGYPEYSRQYVIQRYLRNEKIRNAVKPNRMRREAWFHGEKESLDTYAILCDLAVFPDEAAKLLGSPVGTGCIEKRYHIYRQLQGRHFDQFVKYKMAVYLPELLVRQDKMSMANSIENRVPFLDNEIVAFAFQLPYEQLMHFGVPSRGGSVDLDTLADGISGKYILKKICESKFDRDFAFRGKGGFGLPLKYYFSSHQFREFFYDEILSPMKRRDFLDASFVERLYERLPVLDWRELELLWKAVNIEVYMQVFLDRLITAGRSFEE